VVAKSVAKHYSQQNTKTEIGEAPKTEIGEALNRKKLKQNTQKTK